MFHFTTHLSHKILKKLENPILNVNLLLLLVVSNSKNGLNTIPINNVVFIFPNFALKNALNHTDKEMLV